MKLEKLFYKEMKFLEKDYNFEFLIKSKGIDERFVFKKKDFEIGYFTRTSQFDNLCYFYYSIREREEILNIDEEFYKLFKYTSKRRYFWQLGMIIKEQLKENKVFGYSILDNGEIV